MTVTTTETKDFIKAATKESFTPDLIKFTARVNYKKNYGENLIGLGL